MLYIIATPIGNIRDISERSRSILESVDFILCEDTRKTSLLLKSLEIPKKHLISCHAHNEQSRVEKALEELSNGKIGAYVSDAGTPAVSDPGMRLVSAAHRAFIPVMPLPGPSAVVTALSAAGFETPPFHFLGFAPRKSKARIRWLIDATHLDGTLVLFESGKRMEALIRDLQVVMPDREMCLCRELTKTHQEIFRNDVLEFEPKDYLGEVTLVIGPGEARESELIQQNTMKRIAQELGVEWGITKREAYNILMQSNPNNRD